MEEICANLIKELDWMYQSGLKKFPSCTNLRLSYAFFLIEQSKKPDKAKLELERAKNTKPAFDEQFLIYKYLRKLEETTSRE